MSNRIKKIYTKQARFYDISEKIYVLFGFREEKYRQKAIAKMNLKESDVVVDLGCGTGKNFALIQKSIGPNGTIIGIDFTAAMLEQARHKVVRHGWQNVELLEMDMSSFTFPSKVDAVLSTFSLSFSDQFDVVVKRAYLSLPQKGKFVIADMCWNENLPLWMMKLFVKSASPFGVSEDSLQRNLVSSLQKHFDSNSIEKYYFGSVFIAQGSKEKP